MALIAGGAFLAFAAAISGLEFDWAIVRLFAYVWGLPSAWAILVLLSTKESVLIDLDRAVLSSGKKDRESPMDRLCPLVVAEIGERYSDGTGGLWKLRYQVITKGWNSYVVYESFSRKRAEKKLASLNEQFKCPLGQ